MLALQNGLLVLDPGPRLLTQAVEAEVFQPIRRVRATSGAVDNGLSCSMPVVRDPQGVRPVEPLLFQDAGPSWALVMVSPVAGGALGQATALAYPSIA